MTWPTPMYESKHILIAPAQHKPPKKSNTQATIYKTNWKYQTLHHLKVSFNIMNKIPLPWPYKEKQCNYQGSTKSLKDAIVWLDWVLWHINLCRLFYAKSSLCKYQINDLKTYFVDNTFRWACVHFFFRTQSNVFKCYYVTQTIWFNISHLFAHSYAYTFVSEWFVGHFIFKRVRANLLVHKYF